MAKKGYTAEQTINKIRESEILLSQGVTIAVISKKIGVSTHTYYAGAENIIKYVPVMLLNIAQQHLRL
jgi:hypothetical protein